LQVTLWLEKLYLTEQATTEKLKCDESRGTLAKDRTDGAM